MPESRGQDLSAKKSEIEFRRKLAEQHTEGKTVYADEPDADEIMEIISFRIDRTRDIVKTIREQGIKLSPFIEIGAERCQRSLVLENEYGCSGIAVDISLDSLLFAERIADDFGYGKMPVRVCCDANSLPIRSDAFNFAICFQTLHHFSDPSPVVNEIDRVLSGSGVFYFDEEPVHMRGRVALYRRGNKPVNALENILSKLKLIDFISDTGRAEVEEGLTETDFTLSEWADILDIFDYSDVKINSRKLYNQNLRDLQADRGPKRWWVEFMGGNIYGLCRVSDNKPQEPIQKPIESLICPQCLSTGKQNHLEINEGSLACGDCNIVFPKVHGVYLLFERDLGRNLYPDYFA